MKFSLECQLESKIQLPKEIEIKHKDRTYIFYPNENNLLNKIKIISAVKNPEKFYSEIKFMPEKKVKHHMTINRDKELFDSIINDFKELESILAFSGNLKRIMWDNPKDALICETEEERQKVKILGTKFRKEYPNLIKFMDEDTLKEIIFTKAKYSSLTIPKAFWREGKNDFKSFRYINAFFNFYFIIEGLYGNGKTRNYAIEEEFKKSKDFRNFVKWIIDRIEKETKHFNKINEMLKYRNKNLDIDGLIHLLVATRGALHHFADNPHKTQGTPFDHKEFETIAWISLGLATRAISQKILEINTGENDKESI